MNYSEIVQDVLDGKEDPLKAYKALYVRRKEIEDDVEYIKKCIEKIKPDALQAMGGNSQEMYGVKFEYRKGSRKFDFSNISDWIEAKKKIKEIEEMYKISHSVSKSSLTGVVAGTGELLEVPMVTYGDDNIIVK